MPQTALLEVEVVALAERNHAFAFREKLLERLLHARRRHKVACRVPDDAAPMRVLPVIERSLEILADMVGRCALADLAFRAHGLNSRHSCALCTLMHSVIASTRRASPCTATPETTDTVIPTITT